MTKATKVPAVSRRASAAQRLAWILLLALLGGIAQAANNFVQIKLPHNVRVEIPVNWEALSRNQRITLDSSVQARNEPLGLFDASSDLNFAANYYDDAHKVAALMNVRYYPEMDISQADVRAATPADVKELDAGLLEGIKQSMPKLGATLLAWRGTRKETINGITVLISEYLRSPINNNGETVVRMVRVLNGPKSFTLTVSYRERNGYLLRPICDRIIASLRA